MNQSDPLDRVAIALDTGDRVAFSDWCQRLAPRVGVVKIGLEAFQSLGPWTVEEARRAGARRLFLDWKLHDIPATVQGAVRAAARLGAHWVTVHASGGRRMLEAGVEAAEGRVGLLAVTVLTHLEPRDLQALGWTDPDPAALAECWARVAHEAGCAGVVCSPQELRRLRPILPPPFLLVTPGIRPAGEAARDQRRIATPREALAQGADLLVVGRPLTQAPDPEAALVALATELAEAMRGREPS